MFTKERIRQHFFLFPNDKLRVREIERKLQLSLPSVIRYVKELEQEQLLTTITIGTTRFYTANKAEIFFKQKILDNLRRIYESNIVSHLKRELHNPTIVLFGSYSKGEDDEKSDIDLYVETKKKIDLTSYEKELARPIQLFSFEKIQDVPNPHLRNNIINGITLNKQLVVYDELERLHTQQQSKNNHS